MRMNPLRRKVVLVAALALLMPAGCRRGPASPPPAPMVVFAAASLADAFHELNIAFAQARPELPVVCSFAGSNQLVAQIESGAPARVLVTADEHSMARAVQGRHVRAEAVREVCGNELALVVPANNPARVQGLSDLTRADVRVVMAAPAVPAGAAAAALLSASAAIPTLGANFPERVMRNVRSQEENVRMAMAKVELGEADVGIVYRTDALAAVRGGRGAMVTIPDALNQRTSVRIAVTARAEGEPGPTAFVEFVLSAAGQRIMAEHGFVVAEPALEPATPGPAPSPSAPETGKPG
ncbi:MAG: molybdate ABC transporter substrate-binding protein [Phycisphaerales bacterium]